MEHTKPFRSAHRTSRFWICAALFAWPVTACDDDGPRLHTAVYENSDTLCLLQRGGRVRLYALRGVCGCSRIRTATCAAVAGDDAVVVSSRAVIDTNAGAGITCPDGCYTASVVCNGELPDEGLYAVTYGPEQAVVELPPSEPLQLFGRDPSSPCDDLVDAFETNPASEQDAAP